MKYTYILNGLDCAHCAQVIEDKLNNLPKVSAKLNFVTKKLSIETEFDEIKINEIVKDTVIQVEPDVIVENEVVYSYTLNIKGLDCAHCAQKIENLINEQNYIVSANLNFSQLKLYLKANKKIDKLDLLNKITALTNQIEDGVEYSYQIKDNKSNSIIGFIKNNQNLITGIICFIGALMFKGNLKIFLYFLSYLLVGNKVLIKAIKNIFKGQVFDENFLMTIASITALLLGDYGEACAVMIFYSLGEVFQDYAVNRSRKSISELLDIKSDVAFIKKDEQIISISPEQVNVGQTIVVKVGQKIPLDGRVIKGATSLDLSSLTGESIPVDVEVGNDVLSGSINLSQVIEVEVTKPYKESTVSKIIDLVENASSKKAPIERFITKFARVYTPIVVLLALFVAIIMPIITNQDFSIWLYRAATFLVVSCPCALVISIPLSLFSGVGRASKLGVLIKGSNYLELLKDIDYIVFDKTGTLTKGKFEVKEVVGKLDLLKIAAHGEYFSNHPIAKSIVNAYQGIIDSKLVNNFQEVVGKGISFNLNNCKYYVGNFTYINQTLEVEKYPSKSTVLYVANDIELLGYIILEDTIKESAYTIVDELKKMGIKQTVMLTGDKQEVAQEIGNTLKIDKVYSNLLPQDKVEIVEKLVTQRNFAFIGDGVNDAPVLARSNIGIAMGVIGSDVAIEAADIVLMKDDLTSLTEAIKLSKYTHKILLENIIFSLGIKILILILAFIGVANMWLGVFGDVGVTILAILNSMRILYKKI